MRLLPRPARFSALALVAIVRVAWADAPDAGGAGTVVRPVDSAGAAPAHTDGGTAKPTSEALHDALVHCGPGDALGDCIAALERAGVPVAHEADRAVVAVGGPFFAVALDARGGANIIDVVFRGMNVDGPTRGKIARYLDEHAGAFAFSEACKDGDRFCGVFYPKQPGAAAAVEIGFGLLHVTAKPAWRKPPTHIAAARSVYARGERILDVERTPADGIAVQFSLPLRTDGKPADHYPLLRPAFDAFARAPFVQLP